MIVDAVKLICEPFPHLNSLLFADFPSDGGPGEDADGAENGEEAVQAASFSHRLGNLSSRITRHEISDHTKSTVVEATEDAVSELAHFEK